MVLNDKQRQAGADNFRDAVKISRRQMLTGAVAIPSAAAMYFGYEELKGEPVRAGLIGTGNQGCYAHIAQSNPAYVDIVAFSDIRPSNQARARQYFRDKYGPRADKVQLYEDYHKMLERDDIEMIIIALPLFLHAPATIASLKAGKHVLCEKLMAGTVMECKEMVRAAAQYKRFLSIGHQRHYSYMYANARSLIEQGVLGDIRHIRAFWHRNQTGNGAPGAEDGRFDSWYPPVPKEDAGVDFQKFGYDSIEQMIRWRVDPKTGGGLMVELGSHQLDACSIFLQAMGAAHAAEGAAHHHILPTAVHGTGLISYFKNDRKLPDHAFLTYEYGPDAQNAVVMYSSISTNAFDGYGEQVMGTKATLILLQEAEAYVFQEGAGKDTRINWAESRVSRAMADSGSTRAWGAAVGVADTLTSRGYREEQEHLAWLIRSGKPADGPDQPRCNGLIGLNDAVVTLVSNLAMDVRKRIVFKPEWFDPASDAVPETDPDVIGKT